MLHGLLTFLHSYVIAPLSLLLIAALHSSAFTTLTALLCHEIIKNNNLMVAFRRLRALINAPLSPALHRRVSCLISTGG